MIICCHRLLTTIKTIRTQIKRLNHQRVNVYDHKIPGNKIDNAADHQQSRNVHKTSLDYGKWDPVIGLEIHAQINSKSKLFSPSDTSYESSTNSSVSFFDAALPGSLPVLNERCVEAAILTGLSLNCTINSPTSFDRKHYFYPDLPSGYQITQSREPIAVNGYIDFCTYQKHLHPEAYTKRSVIKQIQLEQDSGRTLVHDATNTCLIDLNRAGVGLMELVFEPDLSDGEEAVCLVKDLILILKSINTCSCKLEEGSLRVDVNVSVKEKYQTELGTRTELKNLNSLRSISRAIDHEIRRQIKLIESRQNVINETRMFDAVNGVTVAMRDKDVDNDYRFMPEPNLPPLWFKDSGKVTNGGDVPTRLKALIDINDFRKDVKPSPDQERKRLMDTYGINLTAACKLLPEPEYKSLFEQLMAMDMNRDPLILSDLLLNTVNNILDERKEVLSQTKLTIDAIGDVADLIQSKTISLLTAADLLTMAMDGILQNGAKQTVDEKGWYLIHDQEEIKSWCQKVIEEKPKRAKDYSTKGKKFALNVLMNVVRIKTNNRINDKDSKQMFDTLLKPPPQLD